jgi:quinol monooxygenase YgiN
MNDTDLVVMTKASAKPGKEEEVLRALRDVAEAGRAQSGCVDYRILRSADDAAATINFERWSSEGARDAFLAGPDVERFSAAVAGAFAESPQPVSYEAID